MKKRFIVSIAVLLCMILTTTSAFAAVRIEDGVIIDSKNSPSIDTANYEVYNFIDSIVDTDKKDLLLEYWCTPVTSESSSYEGDIEPFAPISDSDALANIKELAQLTIEDLSAKVESVREASRLLENSLEDQKGVLSINLESLFFERPEELSNGIISRAEQSKKETMQHVIKNSNGSTLIGVKSIVEWRWNNGKITYIAPDTTTPYDASLYSLWGALGGDQGTNADKTIGVVMKFQRFSSKSVFFRDMQITIAGNFYTDGTYKDHGEATIL